MGSERDCLTPARAAFLGGTGESLVPGILPPTSAGAGGGKGIFPLGDETFPLGERSFPLDEIDSPSGKTGLFLKTRHSLRVFRVGTGKIRRLAASEGFEFYRDAAGRRCATAQIPKEPAAIPNRPGETVKNLPVPVMDSAGSPPVPPVAGEQRQWWMRRARTA